MGYLNHLNYVRKGYCYHLDDYLLIINVNLDIIHLNLNCGLPFNPSSIYSPYALSANQRLTPISDYLQNSYPDKILHVTYSAY